MRLIPLLILLTPFLASAQSNIYISEILASNLTSLEAEDGENYDWIELYNDNNSAVSIAGYYISDDLSRPNKFRLSTSATDLTIPAKGFLVLFASGETAISSKHVDFKLSAGGEAVGLYDPNLTPVEEVTFSTQKTDVSYGRLPVNSSNFFFFSPSSPGELNLSADSYIGFLDPPSFSHEAGFYEGMFDLDLTVVDTSIQIIYTLDGSEPSTANLSPVTYYFKNSYPEHPGDPVGQSFPLAYQSNEYLGPIEIRDRTSEPNKISQVSTTFNYQFPSYIPTYQNEKITVVKAIANKSGYLPSDIITKSYFFKTNGEKKYNLPHISLSFTESKLFEYQNGIAVPGSDFDNFRAWNQTATDLLPLYVGNYYRSGRDYEIEGNVEYFEDLESSFNQRIGIRVHGNRSRHFPLKSLRLYSRSDYGKDEIEYPIFGENTAYDSFKRLILRNGGNDFYYTQFRDAILQRSVRHLNFDIQEYQPAVLYLNGEFWGLTNIRERHDDDYLKIKYDVSKDSVDVLENDALIEYGDANHYNSMINYLTTHDISIDANYEYLKTQLDPVNFIDYQSAEIFFGNQDWPGNNIQFWRKKVAYTPGAPYGHDGRWRWMMYDVDNSAGSVWNPDISPSFNALQYATWGDQWYTKVLYSLLQNENFKYDFIIRNADLLNTSFKYPRIGSLIDSAKNAISSVRLDHIQRWKEPLQAYNSPIDTTFWNLHIDNMKTWLEERPYYHDLHIKDKFGISGNNTVVLEVNNQMAGHIKINTVEITENTPGVNANPYPWSGIYYKNIKNTFVAIPHSGYSFLHWEVDGVINYNDTLEITTSNNVLNVKAFFELNILSDDPFPLAYNLSACEYKLTEWDDTTPGGEYPTAMTFVYMNEDDPGLNAQIAGNTSGLYNLESRTRINGLDQNGFSFINTGNSDGNPGYPGTRLGGVILALNTEGVTSARLKWTGRTIEANSREYHLALKYRIGDAYPFSEFEDESQNSVIYMRQASGDSMVFDLTIPDTLLNQPYIQLFWQYYFTGTRNDPESGARDQLAIDDIILETTLENSTETNASASRILLSETLPVANYHFKASKSIELQAGFYASDALVFKAEIANCLNE